MEKVKRHLRNLWYFGGPPAASRAGRHLLSPLSWSLGWQCCCRGDLPRAGDAQSNLSEPVTPSFESCHSQNFMLINKWGIDPLISWSQCAKPATFWSPGVLDAAQSQNELFCGQARWRNTSLCFSWGYKWLEFPEDGFLLSNYQLLWCCWDARVNISSATWAVAADLLVSEEMAREHNAHPGRGWSCHFPL